MIKLPDVTFNNELPITNPVYVKIITNLYTFQSQINEIHKFVHFKHDIDKAALYIIDASI